MPNQFTSQEIERFLNWTLPGLAMYYRDTQLPAEAIAKYTPGLVFRSATFVDVSAFAGQLTKNCRFVFASSKAAPIYKFNADTEKWQLHTMNCNSYFKVLDVYTQGDKTQIFLLHIPAKAIAFFENSVLKLGENNVEEQITARARESFDSKMKMAPVAVLEEQDWIDRTNFPIGLDKQLDYFTCYPTEDLYPPAKPLYTAIRKMTGDEDDLNEPEIRLPGANPKTDNLFTKGFGKN